MTILDIETYGQREEDLAAATRLLEAEHSRLLGTRGYTIDEFKQNMKEAIANGAANEKIGKNGHEDINFRRMDNRS